MVQIPTLERKEYVINLKEVEDKLNSDWWNKMDPFNFGFSTQIPLITRCHVKEFDFLIQKLNDTSKKFISIQYYQILDGKAYFVGVDNNKVKTFLSDTLFDYVISNNKLPYACHYIKEFKNGNVQIDYVPTKWDKYAIHLTLKQGKKREIEDIVEFFHDKKPEETNPALKRTISKNVNSENNNNININVDSTLEKKSELEITKDTILDFLIVENKKNQNKGVIFGIIFEHFHIPPMEIRKMLEELESNQFIYQIEPKCYAML